MSTPAVPLPADPAAAGAPDVNAKAAAFAGMHGSFSLRFDAAQNYVRPDDCPWTLELDSEPDHGWGGFTAEQALDFAAADLLSRKAQWNDEIAGDLERMHDEGLTLAQLEGARNCPSGQPGGGP